MQLPDCKRAKIERNKAFQAALGSLVGLRLLKHAMGAIGRMDFVLADLVFDESRKPYCPGFPDFNISHSNEFVACAVAETGAIGIDVEERRPLAADLRRFLGPDEHRTIEQTPMRFFDFWTAREAVIKAEGESGIRDMRNVILSDRAAEFRGRQWHLQPLELHRDYAAWVATDQPGAALLLEALSWESLTDG